MKGDRIGVLHTLPDLLLGGGQQLVLRTLSAMDPERFHHVVCPIAPVDGPDMTAAFHDAGVRVAPLGHRGRSSYPRTLKRLLGLAADGAIDVIHANNTPLELRLAQTAGLLTGKPVVDTLHAVTNRASRESVMASEGRPGVRRPLRVRVRDGLDAWLWRRTVERVVANSATTLESWRAFLEDVGIDAARIAVIRPGIPLDRFAHPSTAAERDALRASLGIAGRAPLLVNVARLEPGKGQRHLLDLVARLRGEWPRIALLVVGEGPERSKLEAAVMQAGLADCVRLLGRRDDVAALLGLGDVFVFPSYAEGFGLAVIEAMAAARAVVAFDLPALREFVEPGRSAELVARGDLDALCARVEDLLRDGDRARRIGEAARASVTQRFSIEAPARAHERLYEELARR